MAGRGQDPAPDGARRDGEATLADEARKAALRDPPATAGGTITPFAEALGIDLACDLPGAASRAPPRPLPADGVRRPAPAADRYGDASLVARGGMGEVFAVRDLDLRRQVAMKVMSAPATGRVSTWALARFIEEAQITGQLEHPNIVPVHELGVGRDGRVYFTMKLVEGSSLARLIADRKRTLPQLLRIFLKVCEAVSFAHGRGVIHRDLKPSNVMVGEHGEVLVTDWGIAKILTRPDRPSPAVVSSDRRERPLLETVDGTITGTLAYMAPEQARGEVDDHGPATDIYQLGAILYEILTGKPPVEGAMSPETLAAVAGGKIASPLERAPEAGVSRELDGVVRRAMALAPRDRYPTVIAFIADVEAWLDGRRVGAVEYGPLAPLWMWLKRNRALGLAIATALLSILAMSAVYLVRVGRERTRAVRAERDEAASLAWSRYAEAVALTEAGRLTEAAQVLDNLATDPESRDTVSEIAIHAARLSLANLGLDEDLMQLRGHTQGVTGVAFLPGDRRAVSSSRDGTLRVWDVLTGMEERTIELGQPIASLALARDGRHLLLGDERGGVHLWDLEASREEWRSSVEPESPAILEAVAISPDGRLGIAGPAGSSIRLWDLTSGKILWSVVGAKKAFRFSADGRRVLAGQGHPDAYLGLWDARTGRQLRTLGAHTDAITYLDFLPDGESVVSGSEDTTLKLWDLASGRLLHEFRGHDRGIKAGALSPDGRLLVSASFDRTVRVWEVSSGRLVRTLHGHRLKVSAVAVSADGRFVLSGSLDGTLRLWALRPEPEVPRMFGSAEAVNSIVLARDAKLALVSHRASFPRLWDLESGRALLAIDDCPAVRAMALSRDAASALLACEDGTVIREWDLAAGRERRTLCGAPPNLASVGLSPDGSEAWAEGSYGERLVWSRKTGQELPGRQPLYAYAQQTSSDGRRSIVRRRGGLLELWDLDHSTRLFSRQEDDEWAICAFSPDGRTAVSQTLASGRVLVLDADSGRLVAQLDGEGWSSSPLTFSPDNLHAFIARGYAVSILDLRSGRELESLRSIFDSGAGLTASEDGNVLVSRGTFRSSGRAFQLWDLDYPDRRRRFAERLDAARSRLARSPTDGEASLEFAEYYAARAQPAWALEFYRRAASAGHPGRPERVAPLLWQTGDAAAASGLYAVAEASAPPAERLRLRLCRNAAAREAQDERSARQRP